MSDTTREGGTPRTYAWGPTGMREDANAPTLWMKEHEVIHLLSEARRERDEAIAERDLIRHESAFTRMAYDQTKNECAALISNSAWLEKCIQEERAAKEQAEQHAARVEVELAAANEALVNAPQFQGRALNFAERQIIKWREQYAATIALAHRKG